jgi:Arc/MetJ-type ribon-helix-helix transcriptional regulator
MKTVRTKISDKLYRQMETLIKQGWFPNQQAVFELALRKFLNSHRSEVMEKYLREDVEWGLRAGK